MPLSRFVRFLPSAVPAAVLIGLMACIGGDPTAVVVGDAPGTTPLARLTALDCTVAVKRATMSCHRPGASGIESPASAMVVGGQNLYVKLTSRNVSYDAATATLSFDVTVQNLLNEALGSPDGTMPATGGIRVFFADGPHATSGSGNVAVANADGVADFTGTSQPYFEYDQILAKDQVSDPKTWMLAADSTVDEFDFKLYLSTDVQPLLVINEILVNPGGTITDASGEWVELYNAGRLPVNLQNLVIVDSSAAGRRPYHLINQSLVVQSGDYVTLGRTANTTNNGGVPIDYVYTLNGFANSLGAFKVSRVYGTDTLTIDRTQYANAAVSAQNGISRELKNPALDNSNMDGSNWADASVTAVYGPGGRGTPKAQNSTYTPNIAILNPDTLTLGVWRAPQAARAAPRRTAGAP